MPEDVQPTAPETSQDGAEGAAEGQGSEGLSDLYDLESVSPEVREILEPHLKTVQGNVERKFREHADYRKQWEPYEQLGVNDFDPEQLSQLLAFAQMANDPEQFKQWYYNVGQEMDLLDMGETEASLEAEAGLGELDAEQVQKLVADAVAEKTQPLYESLQRQEQEQLEAQAYSDIQTKLDELERDHGLTKEARDTVLQLAYSYADEDEDPIAKGFEDYQRLIAEGEKGLFARKSTQPGAPEGPGAASTSPERITSFKDPRLKAIAAERLKQSATT